MILELQSKTEKFKAKNLKNESRKYLVTADTNRTEANKNKNQQNQTKYFKYANKLILLE